MNADNTQLKIEYRALHVIKPLPGNTRQHDLEGIISSIREFGFVDPILISKNTFHDLDGNGRLEALRRMYAAGDNAPDRIIVKEEKAPGGGGKPVPVWYAPTMAVKVSIENEGIIALRLNRTHGTGKNDELAVFRVLQHAESLSRIESTGYDKSIFEMLALRHDPSGVSQNGISSIANDSPPIGSTSKIPAEKNSVTRPSTELSSATATTEGQSRNVVLFFSPESQSIFYERTQRLIKSKTIKMDDDVPVRNLTDLIFMLVQSAAQALAIAEQGDDD